MMNRLKEFLVWFWSLNFQNISLWLRDTFLAAAGMIWILLHSQKLSEVFPVLPDIVISDFINVLWLSKGQKWCGTLGIIGLIWNRAVDKRTWPQLPFTAPSAAASIGPTDPLKPKGA